MKGPYSTGTQSDFYDSMRSKVALTEEMRFASAGMPKTRMGTSLAQVLIGSKSIKFVDSLAVHQTVQLDCVREAGETMEDWYTISRGWQQNGW
ncbi:unnamed protein product [Protopolystoma xenopodis]|uniref:Uncharacterized protein n=1 Tax=Protopolystoma xenopodis TaxID=117903 RepID=A0A448XPW4_9PLAT|nr:unnamed protein product [Protopolystoma xenopodis]